MRSFTAVIAPVFSLITLLMTLLIIASPVFAKGKYSADKAFVCKDYDVFVLRHLEKEQSNAKDPGLNEKGKNNAKQLSQLSVLKNISHGFYTPYKRTYETLQFLDIPKAVYQPNEVAPLVADIKKNHCGKSVIVVGHSNTVPSIIKAFGGGFGVSYAGQSLEHEPKIKLNESDYGSIFRITFHNERLHQQLYNVNQEITKKVND